MQARRLFYTALTCLTVMVLAGLIGPNARGDDKKEDKKKEDKQEKVEPWVEIRTAHFVVDSDGGEKTARRIADQFELLVRVFQATMPNAHFNHGIPIQILAAKDGPSFARLFVEFPFDKKRTQPAGLFLDGPEKPFIGIRANASGPAPYQDIFRDYSRMVVKLSYRNLPPWLEEGYSNVYGSLILTDRGARLDRPDSDDISVLFESPLLPLDLVLKVDRDSPYYSAGDKTTVYSAESRAFVHFLLTDPQIVGSKALEQFITRVEGGADALTSAKQAFGDLNQLQTKLEAYIKQTKAPPADLSTASGSDSGGAAKTLSTAESEARMGAFDAARGRRGDAEDKLEDALKLDPSLAEAEQTLGFMSMQHNELEDADKHFTRAMELNANDALNYYGRGMVAMSRGGFVGVPVGAVVAFEKTITLNPEFAPAWYNLASIYALRPETLQKALTDAQRAVSLAPGDSGYRLQVTNISERLAQNSVAAKNAAGSQSSSMDSRAADKPAVVAGQTPRLQSTAPAVSTNSAPSTPPPSGALRIERKTEPEDSKPTIAASKPRSEPAAPAPPVIPTEARLYSMVGTIADVVCSNAPQIQITLKSQMIVMKLHADDFGRVTIKSAGSTAATKNTACASLRGRTARVSYFLVSDKTWDGEMQTVEFR